jgi:D-mannonate dehydratase
MLSVTPTTLDWTRTGVAVKLSAAIVAWKYTRQKIVTLSTEAEYVAASQNIKEFIWLKLLLSELGIFEDFK